MSFQRKISASRRTRRLRAFTLIELIIAVALAVAVTPPVVAALKNASRLYKICRDERIAERRAETVAAVLKMPLRHCGLGIPMRAEEYKKAFGSKIIEPFNWDGPVSVTGESGKSGRLRIAYAFPEGSRATEACAGTGGSASPRMTREPDENYFDMDLFDKSRSVKNWVLFPDAYPEKTPLTVTGISGRTLRLRSYTEDEYDIPKGAPLFLFRALECWSDGEKFYTRDFRTTGGQPRADGVIGARFELNDEKNLLTLCLMVRGEERGLSGEPVKNRGCPDDFVAQWDAAADHSRSTPSVSSGGSRTPEAAARGCNLAHFFIFSVQNLKNTFDVCYDFVA